MYNRLEGHASGSTLRILVTTLAALTFTSCKKDNAGPDSSGPAGRTPILNQTLYDWETLGILPRQSSTGADDFATMNGLDIQVMGGQTQVIYRENYQDQLTTPFHTFYKAILGAHLADSAAVTTLPFQEKYNRPGSGTNNEYNYQYRFAPGRFVAYQSYETNSSSGGFYSATMQVTLDDGSLALAPFSVNDGTYGLARYFSDGFAYWVSKPITVYGANGQSTQNYVYLPEGGTMRRYYQAYFYATSRKLISCFQGFRMAGHVYGVRRLFQEGKNTQVQIVDTTIDRADFNTPTLKVIARFTLPEIGVDRAPYEGYSAVGLFGNKAVILISKKDQIAAYSWQLGDTTLQELYTLNNVPNANPGTTSEPTVLDNFEIAEDGTAYVLKDVNGTQVQRYNAAGVQLIGKALPFTKYGMNNLRLINGYLYAAVGPRQAVADPDQQLDIVRLKL